MAGILPPLTTETAFEKVVHSNLTRPVGYDDVNKEALKLLNPDYFSGLYLEYCPAFSDEKFRFSSTMGPAHYYLGAYYFDQKRLVFSGEVDCDGTLTGRVKAIINDRLIVYANTEVLFQLRNTHLHEALVSFEYLALNYRAQFQLWSDKLIGATYIHRVTPRLSLGGEFFWASMSQKSFVGYAARYETDKMVASAQVKSSGDVLMTYVQNISNKVSLATDFVYNCFSRDVKASVGYSCNLSRQSSVKGKIDSNGVAYALLEKKLNMGLECLLSASLDHKNKDYKLGLSLTFG